MAREFFTKSENKPHPLWKSSEMSRKKSAVSKRIEKKDKS